MWDKQWIRCVCVFRITLGLPSSAASLPANSLQHVGEMCCAGNVLEVKMELALSLHKIQNVVLFIWNNFWGEWSFCIFMSLLSSADFNMQPTDQALGLGGE